MHDISQKLAVATKHGTWEPAGFGWTEADLTELRHDACEELLATKTGQDFLERGGNTDRILEVYAERYAGKTPSDTPFYEVLLEITQDLLMELPEPVSPAAPIAKPTAPAPVVTPEARAKAEADTKAKADRLGKVKQFAHLYNDALINHGIASLKSRNGFVTVRVGAGEHSKSYEFPADEATRLLDEAISLGLIR